MFLTYVKTAGGRTRRTRERTPTMTLTSTAVRDIPPIRHDEAMDLAAAEYQRVGALLHDLAPGDWTTATVCDRWDVRAVAAHVLGAAEACASIRENIHQMRLGHQVQRQLGLGHIMHGANEVQVRERAALDPATLISRWDQAVPRALRGRRQFPPFLRPVIDPAGSLDAVGRSFAHTFQAPLRESDADDGNRERAAFYHRVERWENHLVGEVARHAEEHQRV